jgi:hypothetical protein
MDWIRRDVFIFITGPCSRGYRPGAIRPSHCFAARRLGAQTAPLRRLRRRSARRLGRHEPDGPLRRASSSCRRARSPAQARPSGATLRPGLQPDRPSGGAASSHRRPSKSPRPARGVYRATTCPGSPPPCRSASAHRWSIAPSWPNFYSECPLFRRFMSRFSWRSHTEDPPPRRRLRGGAVTVRSRMSRHRHPERGLFPAQRMQRGRAGRNHPVTGPPRDRRTPGGLDGVGYPPVLGAVRS